MKDQLIKIAEALEEMGLEWRCTFHVDLEVGALTYPIAIERKGSALELTTVLPGWILGRELEDWQERVKNANSLIDAGTFAAYGEGQQICYRVYSLYTREDEIKDAATIQQLLECCKRALVVAEHVTRPKGRRFAGGFFSKVSDFVSRAMEKMGGLEEDDLDFEEYEGYETFDPEETPEPEPNEPEAAEPETAEPEGAEQQPASEPKPENPAPESRTGE